MRRRPGTGETVSRTRTKAAALLAAGGLALAGCATPDCPLTEPITLNQPVPPLVPVATGLAPQNPNTAPTPNSNPNAAELPVCQGVFANVRDGWALVRPVSEYVSTNGVKTFLPKLVHLRFDGASSIEPAPLYRTGEETYRWYDLDGNNLGETPPADCAPKPVRLTKIVCGGSNGRLEPVLAGPAIEENQSVNISTPGKVKEAGEIYSRQFTFSLSNPDALNAIIRSVQAVPTPG